MPSQDLTHDASAGAANTPEPTKATLKDCSCNSTSEIATLKVNNQSNQSPFSTTRQPYWKDPRVMVVTETHTITKPGGGWVVDKKKYLEYADGRVEGL